MVDSGQTPSDLTWHLGPLRCAMTFTCTTVSSGSFVEIASTTWVHSAAGELLRFDGQLRVSNGQPDEWARFLLRVSLNRLIGVDHNERDIREWQTHYSTLLLGRYDSWRA
jgi:hypothetical protein